MQGQFGNITKIVFIGSAVLLVIFGLVLCGFGVAKIVDFDQLLDDAFQEDPDNTEENVKVQIPAAILAAAGIITVLIVILGCFGAFKENRIALGIYIPLLLIIFVCLVACIIVLYATQSDKVREKLKEKIDLYDPGSTSNDRETATKFVDSVQKSFKCCGVESYEDWKSNDYFSRRDQMVPESCCKASGITNEDECQTNPESVKEDLVDCSSALNPFGKEVGIIAIVTAVIMIINLITSCILCAMVE